GLVFEKVCSDYLSMKNASGDLPFLFTSIGRWWGTDPSSRREEEIDLIASDGTDYIFGECKWRNEKLDMSVLNTLRSRADHIRKKRNRTYFYLFSKSGFTDAVLAEAEKDETVVPVSIEMIMDDKNI
ncbi:MAG: ATP-binding protein, partial [Oscillospiraceae bacterium]|nr:ATP-binding protein [Oscillospiraceae bacterium]